MRFAKVFARCVPPLVAIALVAIARASAPAAEIPSDTNAIERLTAAEARKLVAEFPAEGVPVQIEVADDVLTEFNGLPLNGLETLDAETAAALAVYQGQLSLGGLAAIDSATAKALTGGKALSIHLHGLTALDADTARVLIASRKVPGWLSGLTTLDEATAAALADLQTQDLALDGLTEISPQVAAALVRTQASTLRLGGLTTLSVAAARALSVFGQGHEHAALHLSGLTALDPETAAVLATANAWSGRLSRLHSLDATTAKELAAFKGLGGLRGLSIDGLTTLDATTARALAAFQGLSLGLDGVTALDAETAAALVEFGGIGLALGGLTRLDPETAAVLAKFAGRVLKLGVPTLHPDVARALAAYKGQRLDLSGLTAIDMPLAEALVDSTARLVVKDSCRDEFLENHPLTPETARACAAVSGGMIADISAFDAPNSVAIARSLAACKGPLELPNLIKISPKALSALIEKEDLVIPLLETLELIPEPDGSPTEEFVPPNGFQERQQRQRQRQQRQLQQHPTDV